MKKYVLITLLLMAQNSWSTTRFCDASRSPDFSATVLSESNNRLSFTNQGGLLGGGVCWWHSRFTRNAIYKAKFNPNAVAESEKQTKEIIKAIRKGDKVITINGYANLKEFSRINEELIQKELESWQRYDGFIRQQWVVGLWGWHRLPAQKMKARVEHLYDYVKRQSNIAYLKLQIKGITAHSWLVTDMQKMSDGYDLKIIDSNYRYPISYRYRFGDRSFETPSYGDVVPYLGKVKENQQNKSIRSSYCQAGL